MGTDIAKPAQSMVPAKTPEVTQSLSPQQLEEHRARIWFEVEVVLQGYWQNIPSDAVKAAMLADWADTLEDWEHEQIVWGLRKWRDDFPSKKPNPSHIKNLLIEARKSKQNPHLIFYAALVNGDRFLPSNMINAELARQLVAGNYITKERAKARGIL